MDERRENLELKQKKEKKGHNHGPLKPKLNPLQKGSKTVGEGWQKEREKKEFVFPKAVN